MYGKLLLVGAGFAAGYVLGAKAGRGRYNQIASKADDVWNDPHVRQVRGDAQEFVDQTAPVVKDKAADAAKKAGDKAAEVTGKAKKTADQASDTAKDVADDATDKAKDVADDATDKAKDATEKAKGKADDATD